MTAQTQQWVRKAEADFDAVLLLRKSRKPSRYDTIRLHCQQCAEKYLKALLQERGRLIARTHDLQRLFVDLLPFEPSLRPLRRGAVSLTQYAVDYRYPYRVASTRRMNAALRHAERVRLQVRAILGLPP